MTHPYRTKPKEPQGRSSDPARIHVATFAFGFVCVLLGAAASGADRAKCAFLGTVAGAVLILRRSQVC